MRLISWNVATRVHCIADQIAALRSRSPDIVALQEVTASTVTPLLDGLKSIGLIHSVNSLALSAQPNELIGPRRTGELLASRWPLQAMRPEEFLVPWPEKIVSAVLETPRATVEVHVAHVPPGSSNGWTKIRTFEGIFARLATESTRPRILCGDFNSPQEETDDGRTITWGQDFVGDQYACWGKFRGGTGEEWDRGERNVLVGLADFDLPDVFRAVHGFGKKEYSWYLTRKGRRIGRRFDHVFASRQLQPQQCHYLHSIRDAKFSDHSALEVTFAP